MGDSNSVHLSTPEPMPWLTWDSSMVLMLTMLLSINSSINVPIVVSLVFQNSNVLPSEVAAGMKHHMIVILVFHSVTKRFRSFQNPFSRSSMLQKISAQHQEIVIPTFSKSHNCISKEKHVIMVLICINMMVLQRD